jgi:hypothetical protein
MYQYFLKVVPTTYSDVRNASTHTNQYSVTENFRDGGPAATGRMLPGVFFFYDLSPIKVGAGWGAGLKRGGRGGGPLAAGAGEGLHVAQQTAHTQP